MSLNPRHQHLGKPLFAMLAIAVLFFAGCDDKETIPLEEQRLFFTADRSAICPSIEDTSLNTVFLTATVFADDGQVQEGAPVRITTSNTSGGPTLIEGLTNERGQFVVEYPVVRPPVLYEFEASIENGATGSTRFFVPSTPILQVSAFEITVEKGQEIELPILVSGACAINGIDMTLEFGTDADGEPVNAFDYVVDSEVENGFLNVDFDATAGTPVTEFVVSPEANEKVNILYRNLDPEFGISQDGTYFTVALLAREDAPTGDVIVVIGQPTRLIPSSKLGGPDYDLFDPPEDDTPRVIGIRISITEPTEP